MRNMTSRIKKLTRSLSPSSHMAFFHIRFGCEEEDFAKQLAEYEKIYHGTEGLISISVVDYSSENESYESYIKRKRLAEDPANCFCWWHRH